MKFLLFFATMLFTVSVFGQVKSDKSSENQAFTVVVTNIDSFQNWAVQQQLQLLGVYRPANIVVLQLRARVFNEKIIRHPQVLYAAPAAARPREELPVPGQNIFVNKINVAQTRFPQLNGSGTIVSIKEFRFDSLDVDLQNRVLASPLAASELTTHAAIMATLVGGAGNASLAGRGAAPGSQLVSTGFGVLLPELDYATQGITVQNHSYGVDIENFYGPNALAYDVSTVENPHLLHVFSAGNSGLLSSPSGIYANIEGFANLTGNFKMAKNVLTVGAVDSLGDVAFFSSRGPSYDGRVKPDIVAFGQDGTSGAAALVSGAAAVLQQAFRMQFDSLPNAEWLRAVLINSADDIGAPGLDFAGGFGNLNVQNAIQTVLRHQTITSKIDPGATLSFPLLIPPNARQLKITLAWNDLPAQAGAPKALVNDLDLTLLDPDGQPWLPWVLNPAPLADSLQLPAVRARDSLNNVEQITLDAPLPGQYDMQVSASQVLHSSQSFSMAYQWDTLGHFGWIYPIRNDPAVAAREVILGWETNISSQTGWLEWKPTGDVNWRLIDSAIVLQASHKRWLLPDTFTEAQLRMRIGAKFFDSDTFLIAKELHLLIGFNCPDSVGLYWNKASAGAEYLLYGLGQEYLEPVLVTRDTFVVLQKSQFPQQRFAVSALGKTHASLGSRSAAPDIAKQGVGCYQKSFYAVLNAENHVDILLQLGTIYSVSKVLFEKWDGAQFVALHAFEPVVMDQFNYTDLFPTQGKNQYRAVIFTANGGSLWSDTTMVYFTGKKDWLVFPNPVPPGGRLQILSNGSGEATFRLFNAIGQLILTKKLEEEQVEIALPFLPEGFYFFEAQDNGKRQWSGVEVVRN